MTELLEQAIAKLKTRPISEQDSLSIDPRRKFDTLNWRLSPAGYANDRIA
ncbi:hypothetical protein [Chamaesiphon sp.]